MPQINYLIKQHSEKSPGKSRKSKAKDINDISVYNTDLNNDL